ncbi:hypothetical protein GCM10025857_19980 [Alicyclobacillus contaminans]|uniref:uroporphyrinogen-III C-methyltransferase n=1 Tax=Alicyclobacillus contaminans TaxID=392016 RepID=UPI0003FAA9A4|nr:uroporphyrinogen-III C-methyltransferase [Alicyclobacillus contaminans]GMA50641.1 hypothetical protein GCM10025857_19980 [Alicyclobacillus contaminans]
MPIGCVYLVGAGPGDPGLLTVKGKRCLEQADAIVFDRLVSPRLLGYARPDAEWFDVGKAAAAHTLPQEEINALLVRLARAGKTVVRLKGGDPFVFGRGGEEAAALSSSGIPWQVVPGVTSAIAAPAYAGIPVTHRSVSPSFTVVTGHRPAGEEGPDWGALATLDGTLLILMGVRQLPRIVDELLQHGKPAETPVALVRWGTRAEQETLDGTLANIVDKVRAKQFQAPACIVVGPVVAERRTLQWAEAQPLFGRRLVAAAETRRAADDLAVQLEMLGAETVALAVEDVMTLESAALANAVLESANAPAVWEFHTALGVACFFRTWRAAGLDVRKLANVRFSAKTEAADAALRQEGIVPDWAPGDGELAGIVNSTLQDRSVPVFSDHPDAAEETAASRDVRIRCLPWTMVAGRSLDARTQEWLAGGFDALESATPFAQRIIHNWLADSNCSRAPLVAGGVGG